MSGSGTGIVTPYPTHRAIDLGGVADNYTRAADLAGNADGQLGIASGWFRVDGGAGIRTICRSQGPRFWVYIDAADRFNVVARNVANAVCLQIVTTPTYLAGSGWHHAAVSWTLTTSTTNILVDGAVPALTTDQAFNRTIDYTRATWGFGANEASGQRWNGALGEWYLNFAEYLDITVAANLALLRHPNGQPASLLADGSGATGTQPIVYNVEEAGVLVNRGSGGAWVTVGAPALSADSPKDRWVASLNYGRRRRAHFGG